MPAPHDPELLLAAACCRWPPSPPRNELVRAAAARIDDWARFKQVVFRQRVAGLVHAALLAAGVEPPSPIAAAIAHEAGRIVRRNLTGAAETARLLRLIEGAGYPVLVVKGVALAALAYGSITLKHSKDIDLLILPDDAPAVIALLEADAYRLTFPAQQLTPAQRRMLPHYGKDVAMVRSSAHPQLELHWRLLHNRALLPGITAISPIQTVPLSGSVTAKTLDTSDLFAYLAVHGAGDGWSRLKWLADFNALLAGRNQAEIEALYAHARKLGAEWCAAQALLLSQELLGLELAPDFSARLRKSRRVRALMAGAYQLMAVRDGGIELHQWWGGQMRLLLMQPLLARGFRYHWHTIKWLFYIQTDMYRSSAPPSLYFLYPLVRLPLWLARRLGSRPGSPEPAGSPRAAASKKP